MPLLRSVSLLVKWFVPFFYLLCTKPDDDDDRTSMSRTPLGSPLRHWSTKVLMRLLGRQGYKLKLNRRSTFSYRCYVLLSSLLCCLHTLSLHGSVFLGVDECPYDGGQGCGILYMMT